MPDFCGTKKTVPSFHRHTYSAKRDNTETSMDDQRPFFMPEPVTSCHMYGIINCYCIFSSGEAINTIYTLKLFDTSLLNFEVVENLADPVVRILGINSNARHLLPLDMKQDEDGLAYWLKHRTIPKNRAFVNSFLAKCGLNANRPMDVITVCKGLSLNDSYWISDENEVKTFDQVNLYENRFSNILANIAFTGYGSSVRSSFASSPEFTTNGMLPKCWRRISGKVYLYKGATSGASNTGYEPYSERYAYLAGRQLGFDVIPYHLTRWKGHLCSACEIFTGKEISYIPVGRIIRTGGMKAVREYYETLGDAFVQSLNEMIVFDALICNTDRHFGNFGVLVDSRTNRIIRPAPLFDHGNALYNFAGDENWQSEEMLDEYAETLLPCVYEDFFRAAGDVLDADTSEKLRKALEFRFQGEGKIHYSKKQVALLEKQIRKRAARILKAAP